MAEEETLVVPAVTAEVIEVGIAGPPGRDGVDGSDGAPGATYRFTQSVPDTLWYVEHNLGYRPNVTIEDSAGTVQVGAVTYISDDTLTIEFASAFSGYANLS